MEFLSTMPGMLVLAMAFALVICGTVTAVSLLATNAAFNAAAKRKGQREQRMAQSAVDSEQVEGEAVEAVAKDEVVAEEVRAEAVESEDYFAQETVVATDLNDGAVAKDEVVAEEIVADEQNDENIVSQTSDTITVRNVDIAGNVSFISYKKSFTAKLIQADDEVKARYSAVKNMLMAYEDMHSRISWDFDSFNIGRNKLAKLGIKGKTLTLYLALDAEALANTKYFIKDVSDVKKYEDVPVKLKLTSKRTIKYAGELIEMMMSELSAKLDEKTQEYNYTEDFKPTSFVKLQEKGLIKEYKVADNDFITKVA